MCANRKRWMVVADAILINAAALLTLTLPLNGDLEVSPASLVFVIARIVASGCCATGISGFTIEFGSMPALMN